jgi:hypothetical protein
MALKMAITSKMPPVSTHTADDEAESADKDASGLGR